MSDQPNDIEAVFVAALGKTTPEERAAYLDEACHDNAEARARVEALLEAHDGAGSFLEKPAAEFVPTGAAADTSAHSADSAADKNGGLDFLLPTEKPDCLGTIGQYEIAEVVGRGGMGLVLKGHDPKLNRVVAVKVLAPELASNASACKRFLREGRAAAAVSHDHVVTIYGIDDSGRLPFIAMEYVSGPSLEDRIKSEGSLEPTEILRIGMQIASGLAAAHAQGLVHRDVKPANILLENGVEKVKITDFELARAVDDVRMTKPGVVTGTPEYMSPEQARGESVDHRTDLFSLGSVLYAMCTGRSPFRAENTVAMIRRVCEDSPRPIQDVNSDIPGWLVQIIEELLAKSAADRFQSAAELAELLGQCLAHLQEPSVNPLPDGLEGRKVSRWRATTRRRGWLAAAAALLVMLGGLSLTEATGLTDVTATVIRIVRGDGTLAIEVDDPGVSVSIDGEQLVITGAGAKEIRLAVGQHELKAVKDGEPVHTESVTITRDGRQVVKVHVKPKSPAESAEAPESEATAVIELLETWPYQGLGELDVLSISRDGHYCAFADQTNGGLAVRNLSTGEDQLLSKRIPEEYEVCISSDGKSVAYVGGDPDKGYDLRIVGVDGSRERILYPNEEKSGIRLAGWSPDGQHVLAALFETVGDNRGPTSVPVRIATISVTDGSTRVLKSLTAEETDNPRPLFSPGGRYVVYSRVMDTASKQQDIFLIPLDGGPEIPLVESPADDNVFGWVPYHKWSFSPWEHEIWMNFLFRSDRRGKEDEIWMIRVADGKPLGIPRLVSKGLPSSSARFPLGPVRTPTRGWVFYYREEKAKGRKYVGSVYVATLDPETGKVLTAPEPVSQSTPERPYLSSPDFSRDGKYLAYHVAPAAKESPEGPLYGPGNIVIRTLETGREREVTLSPKLGTRGNLAHLRWAPDGRSILIRGVAETGRSGIYRVDIETGKVIPVVLSAPRLSTADWRLGWTPLREGAGEVVGWGEFSPDGKTLFFKRMHVEPNVSKRLTRCRIVARDFETGREREIYRNPDGVLGEFAFAVSPDGQRVFIGGTSALELVPSTGGEPRELLKCKGEFTRIRQTITWTPDSRYVLFVTRDQGRANLWRIAAGGGEPERLGELPESLGTNFLYPRMHPDGRQIALYTYRFIPQYRIRMMQIVGLDELSEDKEMWALANEMCAANLRRIGTAIEQYKTEHDDVPDGFADLFPDYLQDSSVLVCPVGSWKDLLVRTKDRKMPCSYEHGPGLKGVVGRGVALPVDFPHREGMTWKDAMKLQLEYFGAVVPVAVCLQNHDVPMCLGYDGEVYEGEDDWWSWERSPPAKAGLLSQLKLAM